MTATRIRDRSRGCLLGLAVGDAVGTTVEFKARGSFEPMCDMVGGGPFLLEPGQWTDDTSMALCLAESLIEQKRSDPRDQIERYVRWYRKGHLSSTGKCFDIGHTTATALHNFESTGNPYSGSNDPHSAGNGSLMRLAPVPIFFFPAVTDAVKHARDSSRTTHAADESLDACALFAVMLVKALGGSNKEEILFGHGSEEVCDAFSPRISAIANGEYREKQRSQIKGSGYVVQSLEAALWCFLKTTRFREAILEAANLGDDADTTAAICGQIAGAYYGEAEIPADWLKKLHMQKEITAFADKLHESPRP